MNEAEKKEWAYRRASGGGKAVTAVSLIISVLMWVEAFNSGRFIHYMQAVFVTVACLIFAVLTVRTIRSKRAN